VNVRQILAGREQAVDLSKIGTWTDQIIKLLNHHQIQMIDPDWQLWVIMQAGVTGEVQWSIWRRVRNA
jgi:hypothetical protein